MAINLFVARPRGENSELLNFQALCSLRQTALCYFHLDHIFKVFGFNFMGANKNEIWVVNVNHVPPGSEARGV